MLGNDFVHELADSVGWLTGVVSNFVSHGFDPDTCTIRRGITGKGIAPNYKIEGPSRPISLLVGNVTVEFTETPGRTFNGRHHREMVELDDLERHDEHWSINMTFDDVKGLLLKVSCGPIH